jgi:PAS domain S-box-containing protein
MNDPELRGQETTAVDLPPPASSHAEAIIASSDDAILSKDRDGLITSWNPGAERLYLYREDEVIGRPIGILIPPHRAGEERRILERILRGEYVEAYETERLRKDGRMVNVSLSISPVRSEGKEISHAAVIARDITEDVRARQRAEGLQRISEALSRAVSTEKAAEILIGEAVSALGADAATLGVLDETGENVTLVAQRGYSEAIETWTTFPLAAEVPMSMAIRTGESYWGSSAEDVKSRYPDLGDEVFRFGSLAVVPLTVEGRTFAAAAFSFFDEREFMTEERAFMLATAQQAANALDRAQQHEGERRAREHLAFISRASEILGGSLDLDATLQRLASVAVPEVSDWFAVDLVEDGSFRNVAVAHADPAKVQLARDLRERYPPNPSEDAGVANVIRTGRPELYSRIPDELLEEGARDREHLRILRELGLISAMCVPLRAHGRTLGAVTFVSAESERRYTESDLAFAQELAAHAALAIENSTRYLREHSAAVTLQRALLPRHLPDIPGVEMGVRYFPAGSGVEAGGDWYDAIDLGDGQLALVIGDVSGRGIAAASIMGRLRMAIRAYATEGHGPAEVAERTDRLMQGLDQRDMATVFILRLDTRTGRGEYVRVGHLPGLVCGPDNNVTALYGRGSPPIGTAPDLRVEVERVELEPGSTVFLYTDGLIESRDRPIDEDIRRLCDVLGDAPSEVEDCLDHVVETLAPPDPFDDVAILAMRLTG